jgi:molybdate transport system substrate-binding protein
MISGAPVDVFISADEAQMDVAERAGALAPGTRIDLLRNQLAIVTAPHLVALLTGPKMLANAAVRRVAIGEPTAVPAGVYARQYLERIGVWRVIAAKVIPTTSVRAALAAVDKGAADAAIVYVTDAAAAKSARIAFAVPETDAPRIIYPAAIGAVGRNKTEAARFLSFLRGPEATAIFRTHGFLPVAAR